MKLNYEQTIEQLRHDLHDIYKSSAAHTVFKSEAKWRKDLLVKLLNDIQNSLDDHLDLVQGIIPNAIYQLLDMDGVTINTVYQALNQPLKDGE